MNYKIQEDARTFKTEFQFHLQHIIFCINGVFFVASAQDVPSGDLQTHTYNMRLVCVRLHVFFLRRIVIFNTRETCNKLDILYLQGLILSMSTNPKKRFDL